MQFFKTFLLPYFDYCLSLAIYYIKNAFQKLCYLYYKVLTKLFKFQLDNIELDWVNEYLKRFNLFSFQHRLVYRLSLFLFNSKIKDNLRSNSETQINYFYKKCIKNIHNVTHLFIYSLLKQFLYLLLTIVFFFKKTPLFSQHIL